MKSTIFGLVLVVLGLISCSREAPLEWSDTPYLNVNSPWVDSNLQTLSIPEKIGQLLYLELDAASVSTEDIFTWNSTFHVGGLQLYGFPASTFRELQQQLSNPHQLSMLLGTDEQLVLNNQFAEAGALPGAAVLAYLSPSDSLLQFSRQLLHRQMRSLDINTQFSPFALLTTPSADLPVRNHLQFVSGLPMELLVQEQEDSIFWNKRFQEQLEQLRHQGVAGFSLERDFLQQKKLSSRQLADLFRQQLDFRGLLVAEATEEDALSLLAGTVDLLRIKGDPALVFEQLMKAYQQGVLTDRELNVRVAKVLQAKEWLRQQKHQQEDARLAKAASEKVAYDRAGMLTPVLGRDKNTVDSLSEPIETIEEHFNKNRWRLLSRQLYEKASVLLYNRAHLLPFRDLHRHSFRLVHLGSESRQDLEDAFARYADFSKYYHLPEADGRYPRLRINPSRQEICVVTLNESLDTDEDAQMLQDLKQLAKDREVVLLHFGAPNGLAALDTTFSILNFPEMNAVTQELAAQILFGGASPEGQLPQDINAYFRAGSGEVLPVTRLSYQIPEALGIAPEKLVGIDAIAQSAIADGAFPGCQVLVAKGGSVVYAKAFGYHDYERKRKVEIDHLYDVASITKVAATTLVAMKLYEQGKFTVNSRLKNYLDCPPNSTVKNIQIRKLLIHQSGLQPHMPVIPYLLFRDTFNVGCDSFFCNEKSAVYPYEVAENFYFSQKYHDQIWKDVHRIPVRSQRRYRYSDVNFYLVQQLLESIGGLPLDQLVRQYFYTPLGLRYATYRPFERFPLDRIVPTQDDERWRQQQVHGYVHDETAALLGGVAGHAGLFANAEDLAVLFQLLLNKGYYGDRQYLQAETIDLFTAANHGNHRGYGFDTAHPDSRSAFAESASPRSFGHTGFTGTCIWADPDNDLIFVFLSNRINPSVRNKKLFRNRIRERIQEVVYDALDSYHPLQADREMVME